MAKKTHFSLLHIEPVKEPDRLCSDLAYIQAVAMAHIDKLAYITITASPCQPNRTRKVDCRIVEPKALPEPVELQRAAK